MSKPIIDRETIERLAQSGRRLREAMENSLRELDRVLTKQRRFNASVRESIDPGAYIYTRGQVEHMIAQRHLSSEVRRVRHELGLPDHQFISVADDDMCDAVAGCESPRGAHP